MEPPLQLDGAAAIGRPTTINRSHATHINQKQTDTQLLEQPTYVAAARVVRVYYYYYCC